MKLSKKNPAMANPELYYFHDDGVFPNSHLPVILYKQAVDLPAVLGSRYANKILKQHHWLNNWKSGIITEHHYHSTSHEVLVAVQGKTQLQLGGPAGKIIDFERCDMLILPAGVAHRNVQAENDVVCIGGYPDGRIYDMNYGHSGEREEAEKNIAALPIPEYDPLEGKNGFLTTCWKGAEKA